MTTTLADSRNSTDRYSRGSNTLLWCGIASSAWYVAVNVLLPLQDPTYDWMSQTISELSAIRAPTRELWIALSWPYTLLILAFGIGLWRSGLRWIGAVFLLQGAINPFWPPMHLRPVLAEAGVSPSDTLHIAFTVVWALLSLVAISLGAARFGTGFRLYSLVTVVLLLVFGFLTGQGAPRMEANLPTPLIGLWERICTGSFMLWVIVFVWAFTRQLRKT